MSDRSRYSAQSYGYSHQANESADQHNSTHWSPSGYRQGYDTCQGTYQQHYGAPPVVQAQRQRKTRAGLLVAGTAAVAMAAGAATAVAVVNHSGHPNVPAPTSAAAGKPSPAAAPTVGQQTSVTAPGSVEQVSAKVLPSVVKIQIDTGDAREEGSGIVLSADGLILTNNHVVAAAAEGASDPGPMAGRPGGQIPGLPRGLFPGEELPDPYQDGPDARDPSQGPSARPSGRSNDGLKATVTLSDGRTAPFTVVGTDPADDIAVIRADNLSGLTPITIGSSKDLKVGQNVVASGSPLGLQGTVTTGIISALNRPVATGDEQTGQHSVMSAIQTDAAINPGNSGGALVDMNGDLIGVNSAIASMGQDSPGGQAGSIGLGFAIPVDQAKRIADQLVSSGTVQRASLGVKLSSNDDGRGATIAGVQQGSPAAAAGLAKGAVITKVDDRVIDGPEALVAAINSKAPGDTVAVVYNDPSGSPQTAEVTLGTQPQS